MKKIYVLILWLYFLNWAIAQTTFDKTYFVTGGQLNSICQTLDNKYIMSGCDAFNSSCKWVLVKSDSLGNIISSWKYSYGAQWGFYCKVVQSPDSGFFMYGEGDYGTNGIGRIMKVDKNGNFLWGRDFNPSVSQINGALALNTGQFLVTLNNPEGYGILKFSPSGNILWSRRNTSNTANVTHKVIQASDGNYVFVGGCYIGANAYPSITKVDTSGNTLWTKAITGVAPVGVAHNICQTSDGGYAIVCSGSCVSVIIKLDANGNYVWDIWSPATGCSDWIVDIAALPGGEILAMGMPNDGKMHLYKFNSSGTSYNDVKISNPSYSPTFPRGGSITQNKNGSIVSGPFVCGWPTTDWEIARIKSNLTGCSVSSPSTVATSTVGEGTMAGPVLSNSIPTLTVLSSPTITIPSISPSPYCTLSPLGASASGSNIQCFGSCTGSGTVTPSGGQSPFTYTWSPSGGNSATASGLCANTYTVLVKDALNSTVTAVVTITQPSAIASSISSQTNVACNGGNNGAVTVSASGGTGSLTYSWSPSGGTLATASSLAAGNYTCTIKDANNCVKTQTVNITQPLALTSSVASQTNVTCNGGSNGAVSVSATGGTGGLTYTWSPSGGNAATATNLTAGIYTCIITDANNCTKTQTVTITQPTAITANVTGQTNVSCYGGTNGTAIVSASGGTGALTYSWSPSGGITATATALSAGTFTCLVKDANNCFVTRTVTITQPSAISSSVSSQANVLCNSGNTGSVTVTASGGTGALSYTWSPSGGNAASATNLSAGIYSCTITDANGCVKTQTVNITQPPALNYVVSNQTNVTCNSLCNGSATLTASGGTPVYSYSPALSNNLCAGPYTYTVTDANSCVKTVSFNITQPSAITASASSSVTTVCAGNSTTLNGTATGGTGTLTYNWSPGGAGANISVSPTVTATYSLTATDSNSCTGTSAITITVNPLPSVSYSQTPNSVCVNAASFSLTAGSPTAGTYSGPAVTGSTFNPGSAGTGTFTIVYSYTDGNNCTNTASQQMIVSGCVGINEISSAQGAISVYPNPTNGMITINYDSDKFKIEIYNSIGELVSISIGEGRKGEADITSQPPGFYFIRVKSSGTSITKKIIKY